MYCFITGQTLDVCACARCVARREQIKMARVFPSSPYPMVPVVKPGNAHIVAPEPSGDEVLPDIEVGRYALRTFRVRHSQLVSVVKDYTWEGGVSIAQCLKEKNPCPSSPNRKCDCGIYGTLTLEHLIKQYSQYAQKCVAVIAAEGTTIIGSRGLRTAAARIVAYWTRGFPQDEVFAQQCPEAQSFDGIAEMLEAYHFPVLQQAWHAPEVVFAKNPRLKERWEMLTKDMLAPPTPEATTAIQHALGFL